MGECGFSVKRFVWSLSVEKCYKSSVHLPFHHCKEPVHLLLDSLSLVRVEFKSDFYLLGGIPGSPGRWCCVFLLNQWAPSALCPSAHAGSGLHSLPLAGYLLRPGAAR